MRTKALLVAAAIAAGAATSMAQSNVYSLNVVGYVNVACSNGYTMVTTPFSLTNYETQVVMANVPLGTTIFNFQSGGFVGNFLDEFGGGWTFPTKPLGNGLGYLVQNNSGSPFTITFVGEVPQGPLTNALVTGYNAVGSKVPQGGYIADLGVTSTPGDSAFKFKRGGFQGYFLDEFGGGWSSSETDYSNTKGPNLNVGEGFLYFNTYGTATWVRNFTVN